MLCPGGEILTEQQVQQKWGLFLLLSFQYRQVWIIALQKANRTFWLLTCFEWLLILPKKKKSKQLSIIYRILLQSVVAVDRAQQRWQIDLGEEILEGEQWVALRKHYYNLPHQWHLTHSRLAVLCYPVLLGVFVILTTFMCIWWNCPKIRKIWQTVQNRMQNILELEVPFKPRVFLSHNYRKWKKKYNILRTCSCIW